MRKLRYIMMFFLIILSLSSCKSKSIYDIDSFNEYLTNEELNFNIVLKIYNNVFKTNEIIVDVMKDKVLIEVYSFDYYKEKTQIDKQYIDLSNDIINAYDYDYKTSSFVKEEIDIPSNLDSVNEIIVKYLLSLVFFNFQSSYEVYKNSDCIKDKDTYKYVVVDDYTNTYDFTNNEIKCSVNRAVYGNIGFKKYGFDKCIYTISNIGNTLVQNPISLKE